MLLLLQVIANFSQLFSLLQIELYTLSRFFLFGWAISHEDWSDVGLESPCCPHRALWLQSHTDDTLEYRQTSTLSHLGIPSLLSSPPLSPSPSICASFSASQPQSLTEISGESTLLVSSETVFFKEPKSGRWGGPPEDQSLRQMLMDPQKSHSSSSARTLILKVRSCPAHPCCVDSHPPKRYVEALTPCALECDLIWKQDCCRCS